MMLTRTPSVEILVADAESLVADGLRVRLAEVGNIHVAAHAPTGIKAVELAASRPFDLVLLEVSLPEMDGIDTMRALRKAHPDLNVLAFSALTEIEYVNSMLIEGAKGYVVKGGTIEELALAIRMVMHGEGYLSERARHSVEQGYAYTEKRMNGEYVGLTAREREIIRMIAHERTNAEIAGALFISEDTVKTHRKNLMTKLNVRSTAGLVKYAIDRRWV